jgi:hypothetical protein
MTTVQATQGIPPDLKEGLEKGNLERVGGVIFDKARQEALAFLREAAGSIGDEFVADVAVSAAAPQAAALNLAVSTMGFAIVMKHLQVIEQKLRRAQEVLNVINYKIDLSFYSNFRAAIDLSANSFSMSNPEMRKSSALQAVNRLLEAEHHYLNLADVEIANGSQVADDFLTTVSLACIAEVRCYLELEEIDTARQRLEENLRILRPRYDRHIRTLLTTNPAAYLHPRLQSEISLARLARVLRWFEPKSDESSVFEAQRRNLFDLAANPKPWLQSLPQAVSIPRPGLLDKANLAQFTKQLKGMFSTQDFRTRAMALSGMFGLDRKPDAPLVEPPDDLSAVLRHLPACLSLIETMIENFHRLEMYRLEIDAIRDSHFTFREWRDLRPDCAQVPGDPKQPGIMCLVRVKGQGQAA